MCLTRLARVWLTSRLRWSFPATKVMLSRFCVSRLNRTNGTNINRTSPHNDSLPFPRCATFILEYAPFAHCLQPYQRRASWLPKPALPLPLQVPPQLDRHNSSTKSSWSISPRKDTPKQKQCCESNPPTPTLMAVPSSRSRKNIQT